MIYCCIVICWFMLKYTYIYTGYIPTQWITDAGRLLYKNIYLSLYCKGSKRVTQGLRVRGSWRPNRNCNILTPNLLAVNVVSFSFSRAAQPMAQGPLCWVMAFFIASYHHHIWTPTHQGPNGPFGLMWLSLPHIVLSVSNSTGTPTQLPWLLSWLSYIIVQRPLDRPLDLWNRMFNRYQAEITVMQFTGHSLPVHQSMSVPWEFFSSSHFISQFPPMRFPLITAIRMCHLLPVHHLGMAFLAGSKGQNITIHEESRETYRPKLCYNINKDEVNSPNIQSNNNCQASSQKFRQIRVVCVFVISLFTLLNMASVGADSTGKHTVPS